MPTAESVIEKLQGLIDTANATTGEADTTLTDAIASLIAGFGSGGSGGTVNIAQGDFTNGATPEKVYNFKLPCPFVPTGLYLVPKGETQNQTNTATVSLLCGKSSAFKSYLYSSAIKIIKTSVSYSLSGETLTVKVGTSAEQSGTFLYNMTYAWVAVG
jgi:hypothetical protein